MALYLVLVLTGFIPHSGANMLKFNTKDIQTEIDKFTKHRTEVAEMFKEFVTDSEIPLAERLLVWEANAEDVLPIGDWISCCPDEVREDLEPHDRNSVVYFQDLIEHLADYSTFKAYWNKPNGELCAVIEKDHPELMAKLEAVFNSGYCGLKWDW